MAEVPGHLVVRVAFDGWREVVSFAGGVEVVEIRPGVESVRKIVSDSACEWLVRWGYCCQVGVSLKRTRETCSRREAEATLPQ